LSSNLYATGQGRHSGYERMRKLLSFPLCHADCLRWRGKVCASKVAPQFKHCLWLRSRIYSNTLDVLWLTNLREIMNFLTLYLLISYHSLLLQGTKTYKSKTITRLYGTNQSIDIEGFWSFSFRNRRQLVMYRA
jgi:hypothetical protein